MSAYSQRYAEYLATLLKPFRKVTKLEFLQPDNSVAFALGGGNQKTIAHGRDTRAFVQTGNLSVNLQNGQRRTASVTLSNLDSAYDYAVNKLWFGQRLRLSMGIDLPNYGEFYLPQGVFYVKNPQNLVSYKERTTSLSLADKWAYLDGTLFGTLEATYNVDAGTNIFSAINSLLQLRRKDYESGTTDPMEWIDNVAPVFTDYYTGRTYTANNSDGSITSDINMTDTPYAISESRGSSIGSLILKLNDMLAGLIGYDATGALRLDPSQDDVSDADKPVLFTFGMDRPNLAKLSESPKPTDIYNTVIIGGEGLSEKSVWAKASNIDPKSDTNVNLIGMKLFTEDKADYWNADQCASLARWYLKRKTILQKAVSIESTQMFHLHENELVSVRRIDKPGSPMEKHLIQGFTIPLGETGSMSISCVSVNDLPDFVTETHTSEDQLES